MLLLKRCILSINSFLFQGQDASEEQAVSIFYNTAHGYAVFVLGIIFKLVCVNKSLSM